MHTHSSLSLCLYAFISLLLSVTWGVDLIGGTEGTVMVDSPLVVKGTITMEGCLKIAVSIGTPRWKAFGTLPRQSSCWVMRFQLTLAAICSTAAHSKILFLSLTSQRLLNSLCSMRSSSLVSLLTMVAWRGVLSRMDSPNAVPIPSVQIVTASCTQTQHTCLNYCLSDNKCVGDNKCQFKA